MTTSPRYLDVHFPGSVRLLPGWWMHRPGGVTATAEPMSADAPKAKDLAWWMARAVLVGLADGRRDKVFVRVEIDEKGKPKE